MTAPYQYTTPEEDELQKLLAQQSDTDLLYDTPTPATTLGAAGAGEGAPGSTGAAPGAETSVTTAPSQIPSGTTPGTMPPPIPPAYTGLSQQVQQFASNWMNTPNRYLTPMVEAQRAAGEARLGQSEQEAGKGINEWAASRGLLGSSYEGEQRVDLAGEMQRARGEQEATLQEMLANAETLDRASAGAFGLETTTQLGNLNMRAYELMQNDRSLDLQEARDLAGQELAEKELAQQGEQFEASLTQRETEFARTLGMTQQQFDESTRQFQLQYGEQVASRLQQNEQFAAALASDEATRALDVGLRARALDLQEAGMQMEDAWRQASLDQERQLTTRAQDLQEAGLNADMAYRYAALEQDGDFRSEQLRLEELGLNMEDSYREAEQALQMRQLDINQQQVDQRMQEIRQQDRSLDLQEARDQAQIDLTREQMEFQVQLQTNEIAQRESEFARSIGLSEREFVAQQDQFSQQMMEQIQSRLQQDQQFQQTYQQEDTRMAMENGLRQEALRLQETGMNADIAFQQAQQNFEYGTYDADGNLIKAGYRDQVLLLQQQGMQQDEAYRYAALAQDAEFTREAQRLQELGLNMEDAYREAALRLQETQIMGHDEFGRPTLSAQQFREEMNFRMRQAETAEEQFDLMYELWKEYFGKSTTGGDITGDTTINVYGGNDDGYDWNDPSQRPNLPEDPGNWVWDGTQYVDQDTGQVYVPDD